MTDLRTAAQQALTLLEFISQATTKQFGVPLEVVDALRAALAEPVQEPVAAWENKYGMKEWEVHALRAGWMPAPPQRKPLTEEEIRDLWSWAMTAEAERTATTQQHAFARAVERAHGIT
jgi:hypothetical protein